MNNTENKSVMVQGRIVWTSGDLFKGQVQKDDKTKQPKLNAAGEPMIQYGFGLAVPKDPQDGKDLITEVWNAMHEQAYTLYPSRQLPPDFAMKFKDGDTAIDTKGIPYSKREGYAKNLVLALTQYFPIKFFRFENGQNIMINEGIKCGDYVNVQLGIKAHPATGQGKPGLYLNPMAVQFLGFGDAIINTPSGDQIFGVAAPAMIPGATAVPTAPQGGQMIVPGAPAAAPPQAAPAPHHAVLPQNMQPGAPQGVPAPQQAPVPNMTSPPVTTIPNVMPPAAVPPLQSRAPGMTGHVPATAAPAPMPGPPAFNNNQQFPQQ